MESERLVAGELSEDSPSLSADFHYDRYQLQRNSSNEILIEVVADFDVTIRLIDDKPFGKPSWHDATGDEKGESLIVGPTGSRPGTLLVQNQNPGQIGKYTIRASNVNTPARHHGYVTLHRALTPADEWFEVDGYVFFVELLELTGFPDGDLVKVEVVGKDGPAPAIALYRNGEQEPVASAEPTFCDQSASIQFVKQQGSTYVVAVAQLADQPYRNYWITTEKIGN